MLVAEHGFHGASMSKVATAAGVAVGTAYVHYESKEDLVHAAYLEAKRELAKAAVKDLDPAMSPAERYRAMWLAAYAYCTSSPDQARFLIQLEDSPFYSEAHRRLLEESDKLVEETSRPDLTALLVDLPLDALYMLSLGTAVRLAASGIELNDDQIERFVDATWRCVTKPRRRG